jgi:hypothetical protein
VITSSNGRAPEPPPHDLEVEHAALGAALHDPTAARQVLAELEPGDFYTEAHRTIFRAMRTLAERGRPIEVLTLSAALRDAGVLDEIGGMPKVAQLFEEGMLAIPANVDAYAATLRELGDRRELLQVAATIGSAARNGLAAAEIVRDARARLAVLEQRLAAARDAETLGEGLGQFLAREFPPTVPYIEGLMSDDGGGWIAGEEKLGKTFWALSEALSLATAETLAGRFKVSGPRRVLFLEEEDSPRRAHRRLRALVRGLGYDPDHEGIRQVLDRQFRIEVWGGFTLDSPAMLARLEATIAAFRPSVVYIDVLRKVTLQALKDEQAMGVILAALDDLRRRYGVLFRIIHHFRKTQGFRAGRGSQELGGSFVLGAWAENSVFLEPVGRKQGAVKVTIQCKDLPPAPEFTLRFTFEGPPHDPVSVRLVVDEITQAPGTAETDDLVFQAVATCPAVAPVSGHPGVPLDALIAATKRSKATVRRALDRLIDARRVVLTGAMSNRTKLYGVAPKCDTEMQSAHAPNEQAVSR